MVSVLRESTCGGALEGHSGDIIHVNMIPTWSIYTELFLTLPVVTVFAPCLVPWGLLENRWCYNFMHKSREDDRST